MSKKHYPHVTAVAHLPIHRRLAHPHVRRHIVAGSMGTAIMVASVAVLIYTEEKHVEPRLFWETFLPFIHGIGAAPLLQHIEPLWLIVTGGKD